MYLTVHLDLFLKGVSGSGQTVLHQGSTRGSDIGLTVAHLALLRLGLHNQVIFPDLLFWGTRRLLLLLSQVWSLTQFYSVDFSKSRIGVKKVRFQQTYNQGLRQLYLTVSWVLRA